MKKLLVSLSVVLMMVSCTPEDGVNGIDGKDGLNGVNGTNGVDGKDGKDGSNFVYTAETIKKDTVIGGVSNKMETLQLSATTTIKSLLPANLTGRSRVGLSGMSIMIKNTATTGKGDRDCKLYFSDINGDLAIVKTKIVDNYITVENKDIDMLLTSRGVVLVLGEGMEKTALEFDEYEQGLIHAFLVRMEYKNTNIDIDSFIGSWTNGVNDTLTVENNGVMYFSSPFSYPTEHVWYFDFANDLKIKDKLDVFNDMENYDYTYFHDLKFEVAAKMKIVSVGTNELVLEHKQTFANTKQYITLYSGAKVEVIYSEENQNYIKLDGTFLYDFSNDDDFAYYSSLQDSSYNENNSYPHYVMINGVQRSNVHYEYIRDAEQAGVFNGTWTKIIE